MMTALILDSEGLSQAVLYEQRIVLPMLNAAWEADIPVAVSAATLVEVVHEKINRPRLTWLLSRMEIAPVTETVAKDASRLLMETGLHNGQKHAIDAMVAATALSYPGKVAILTSDLDDMRKLLADHPRVSFREV